MMMFLVACLIMIVQVNTTILKSFFNLKQLPKLVSSSIVSVGIVVGGMNIKQSSAYSDVKLPMFVQETKAPSTNTNAPQFGLKKDRLLKCKDASNCVSSSSFASLEHYGKPWQYNDNISADEEFELIKNAIKTVDKNNINRRMTIVDENKERHYIRAETRSALVVNSKDDVEFLINSIDKIITYRTNSREVVMAGPQVVSDGGSHRNRLALLKANLGVIEMGESNESRTFMEKESKMNMIDKMKRDSTPNEINFIDNSVPTSQK
jgi:uncharacterized protein (DUF1499 family)